MNKTLTMIIATLVLLGCYAFNKEVFQAICMTLMVVLLLDIRASCYGNVSQDEFVIEWEDDDTEGP
jgi:hypothetical protein